MFAPSSEAAMYGFRRLFPAILGILLLKVTTACAVLPVPSRVTVPDTCDVRIGKGVEIIRLTERLGRTLYVRGKSEVRLNGRWKTEWLQPEGGERRIRQDGRWYLGFLWRNKTKWTPWLAASGEHFDDRPDEKSPARFFRSDLLPQDPMLGSGSTYLPSSRASVIRILRGGAGISRRFLDKVNFSVGGGAVEDRRIGQREMGEAVWAEADVGQWNLGGYDQRVRLEYNRENPSRRKSSDFKADYRNFREFHPGNSNRMEAWLRILERDVTRDPTGSTSRRTERRIGARDNLKYGVAEGIRVEMTGEIVHESTDLGESGTESSSLEENQAGFSSAMHAEMGAASGSVSAGIRSVSQTIRAEILQGLKADLSLSGRLRFADQSALRMKAAVSKYQLDTPSETNFDDRDELRYTFTGAWYRPMYRTVFLDVYGQVRLDHLVYLFKENSANNRWNRLFLTGVRMLHRPESGVRHVFTTEVSANYQDYDFETDPRTTRSTVFRRYLASDSAGVTFGRWEYGGKIGMQIEEFGRLFWDSFEEERSDETIFYFAAVNIDYRPSRYWIVGTGAQWESRLSRRFPESEGESTEVFQDIESYGPAFRFERKTDSGFFLNGSGLVLRQFRLNKDDRWIVTGSIVGGVRW